MKKFILLALLAIPMVVHGQVSSYATLYCVNPSGNIIPLLQAGIPASTNYPGVQAYGMNSLGQSTPLQCDASGNPTAGSFPTGTSLPLTCSSNPVQVYGVVSGSTTTVYYCSAPNTWTIFGGSGSFSALTGDATSTASGGATTVVGLNGVLLSGLGTGILKNTTSTGVPSIAVAADFPTLNQSTSGTAAKSTSLAGGFVSGAGQPYNYADGTTGFVYPATDTHNLTLSLNRTDTYTEDGTIERPYKNLPTLVIPSAGLASIFSSPNASYSNPTAVTLPAIPITIYGNNSTWTPTGGLTVAAKIISYDLIDGAAVTYNYAGTDRSEKHGGAFNGNVNLAQGYLHTFGTNFSGNSNVFTVGGASTAALLYGEAITGSQQIASGGAGALIALYNPNMTKSSGYNINMTNCGQLLFNGGLLNTAAGTANIYLPCANSPSTLHAISGLIVGTGTGVACASGTTTYVSYGFNLAPITNCTLLPGYQGPTNFLGAISSTVGTTGVTNGAAAGSGYVGQVVKGCLAQGSGTTLTSTSTINLITLNNLSAGDWDVEGNVNLVVNALTATNGNFAASITTTSATLNTDGSEVHAATLGMSGTTGYNGISLPRVVVNISTPTNVYLVANFQGTISSGTGTLWGCMTARRVH